MTTGVEILTAADGEEGMDIIREEQPEVVFLDIMMPKMNGYEVCRNIQESSEPNSSKIVLITAKGQEVDKKQGLELGACMYLTKPFDPDRVLVVAKGIIEPGMTYW